MGRIPHSERRHVTDNSTDDAAVENAGGAVAYVDGLELGGEAQLARSAEPDLGDAVLGQKHGSLLQRNEFVSDGAVAGTPAGMDAWREGRRPGSDRHALDGVLADRSVDTFFGVLQVTLATGQ